MILFLLELKYVLPETMNFLEFYTKNFLELRGPLWTKQSTVMVLCRLEELKHQLDLLVERTASLSQKESLYRKAFIRRCENLQMAETEVLNYTQFLFFFFPAAICS